MRNLCKKLLYVVRDRQQKELRSDVFAAPAQESSEPVILLQNTECSLRLDAPVHPQLSAEVGRNVLQALLTQFFESVRYRKRLGTTFLVCQASFSLVGVQQPPDFWGSQNKSSMNRQISFSARSFIYLFDRRSPGHFRTYL